jgi:site-specific DNA-cytosine methylase
VIVGDLFSGIGGFSLAAHWMGWRTAWFSEIDPYSSRVLAHHWPDVPNHGDIRAIDWTTVEPVDVLTGGFPCQPHSLAGLRAGSNDERDLFDEIIRCAGVLRPRFIVLENVPGLFTSDAGRFFGRVLGAVAALGYDAEWRVLSAADVGAPHRRERVWIVAHAQQQRLQGRDVGRGVQDVGVSRHEPAGSGGDVGNPSRARGATGVSGPLSRDAGFAGVDYDAGDVLHWRHAVSVKGADGTVRLIPREAATGGPESPLWPVAHGVSGRVARLRGIGNSIVPACALEIFRAIEARDAMTVAA